MTQRIQRDGLLAEHRLEALQGRLQVRDEFPDLFAVQVSLRSFVRAPSIPSSPGYAVGVALRSRKERGDGVCRGFVAGAAAVVESLAACRRIDGVRAIDFMGPAK